MVLFWIVAGTAGAVLALVAAAARLNAADKRGRRRTVAALGAARRGWTFETFAADFARRAAAPDAAVLRAVYDRFQRSAAEHQGVAAFPVRADDALEAVYDARLVDEWNDFGDEDLGRLVRGAAAACGRRVPQPAERATAARLRTVRDVVEYLHRCPHANDATASPAGGAG